MAPEFEKDALEILKSKKNRVLLILKDFHVPPYNVRTVLNGILVQARDADTDSENNINAVTDVSPNQ